MSNEAYTYQIIPRRPIRSLIPGKNINKPCSMKLTKEQVLMCMKYGPVFRCMPGKAPIRVTGKNLDSLHISNIATMIKKEEKPVENKIIEETPIIETENNAVINHEESKSNVFDNISKKVKNNITATVIDINDQTDSLNIENAIPVNEESDEDNEEIIDNNDEIINESTESISEMGDDNTDVHDTVEIKEEVQQHHPTTVLFSSNNQRNYNNKKKNKHR